LTLLWARDDWGLTYAYDKTRWRDRIPAPYLEAVGDFEVDGTPKSDSLVVLMPGLVENTLAVLGRSESSLDDFIQMDRASVVATEFIGDHNLDVFGHALTLEMDFSDLPVLGDVTFKSITAYRDLASTSRAELDGSPVPVTDFGTLDKEQDQITQEFQLVGTSWNDRLDYVMGFYYFKEGGGNESKNVALDFTAAGFPDPFSEIFTEIEIDNEAWAIYGQATLADVLMPGLSLTLGARYTRETRGFSVDRDEYRAVLGHQTGNCNPAEPDYDPNLCYSFEIQEEESYSNVSPMANISYQWNNDVMSYFRVATGYQSGGFNGRAVSLGAANTPYDEQISIQYELGAKTAWFDHRLVINASVFYTDNEDLQVAQFPFGSDSPNVGTVVQNAGESHVQGAEIELVGMPTANLEMYLNYAYLKGEFDSYIIGYDDINGDGVRDTPVDISDDTVFIQSPENSIGMGARYTFGNFGFGTLWARVDASWQDDIVFTGQGEITTVNAPELESGSKNARTVNQQEAYTLIDASVTLEHIPLTNTGTFKVRLWGRNLTDEQYRYASVDLLDQMGIAVAHYGDPRTYGVTLSYDFE